MIYFNSHLLIISIGLSAEEIHFSNRLWHLLDEEVAQMIKHSKEKTVAHKVKIVGGKRNKVAPPVDHKRTLQ